MDRLSESIIAQDRRYIPNATSTSVAETRKSTNSDPASSLGKIALEEHFDFSETANSSYASFGGQEFQRRIKDLGSGRIAEMDRGSIEICIVSLVGPGIQAIPNADQAVEVARRANDHLAENVAKNPKRLKGFAALALQNPKAAAQELRHGLLQPPVREGIRAAGALCKVLWKSGEELIGC